MQRSQWLGAVVVVGLLANRFFVACSSTRGGDASNDASQDGSTPPGDGAAAFDDSGIDGGIDGGIDAQSSDAQVTPRDPFAAQSKVTRDFPEATDYLIDSVTGTTT